MLAPEREDSLPDKLENEQKKIDLDTILVEEIGQFGRFQLRVLLLAVIVVIFAAWGASEYVFTTARLNTRCLIPQCDTEEPEYSPDWILNAVPGTEGSPDNCQRYGNSSAVVPGVCPAALFDQDVLLPCEEYVYETTDTVVYD
ncbi:Organic cation transporter, partial [Operophtera brumata]